MAICGVDCLYFTLLVEGDVGYDPDLAGSKGKCTLCPPVPSGSYRDDLSEWPKVLATDSCNQCRCRGCTPKQ